MSAGIVAMHYTGMAAMRMPADLSYDALWVSISILIAIGASVVALWLAFHNAGLVHKLLAAGIMGLAISGMHYAAMKAAVFTESSAVDQARGHASFGQSGLAFAVAGTTFILLLLGGVTAAHDRRLSRLIKHEQAARRESEEHLRLALRSGHIVAWEWDLETGSLAWSENVVEILGRAFEVAAAFEACIHPDDRERHRTALETTFSEGAPYELEMRFIKPDGTVIWIRDKAELQTDQDNRRILSGITINITARKQAETDAQEKTALLEATLENMDQGLLMYDANRVIRVYNRKVLELLDLPEDLLASQPSFQAVRDYQLERGELA
jgi:PAS domain S-box-containing protein